MSEHDDVIKNVMAEFNKLSDAEKKDRAAVLKKLMNNELARRKLIKKKPKK